MKARFRFIDARGDEVEVPSLEGLTRLFESGTLRADSLLYDGLTGGWAPAREHPVCQLIFDELGLTDVHEAVQEEGPPRENSAGTGTESPDSVQTPDPPGPVEVVVEGGAVGSGLSAGAPTDDIPLLEPIPEDHVREDTVQAFLAAREQERREEELQGASDTGEVTLVDPGQERLGRLRRDFRHIQDAPDRRRAASPGREDPGGWNGQRSPVAPSAPSLPAETPVRSRGGPARQTLSKADGGARQLRLFLVLVTVGTWGILDAWNRPIPAEPLYLEARGGGSPLTPSLEPGPLVPSDREVREAAFEGMVAGMDRLRQRMRVGEPPTAWMSGQYLAGAGGYPEVASYWIRYGEFVDTLRVKEVDLFLEGFGERMDALGIQGSVRTVRQARVLQDFRTDRTRRESHYLAMDELSEAALTLHAFLRQRTGAIDYTPVDRGLAEDPVLEISLRDDDTRTELWRHLDRLLAALDSVAGPDPDRRRDVTRQILDSLGASGPALKD